MITLCSLCTRRLARRDYSSLAHELLQVLYSKTGMGVHQVTRVVELDAFCHQLDSLRLHVGTPRAARSTKSTNRKAGRDDAMTRHNWLVRIPLQSLLHSTEHRTNV